MLVGRYDRWWCRPWVNFDVKMEGIGDGVGAEVGVAISKRGKEAGG